MALSYFGVDFMKTRLLALTCLTVWCSLATAQAFTEEDMLIKASALTKVAVATESAARYKDPSPDLSEREFIEFSTQHDPSLLEPFAGFTLRARWRDRRSIVLVCTADGKVRLLEDAGCTAELDKHHWRETESACEFSINVGEVCR